jgi:two-component system OmpR family sensor kinase
MMPSQIPTSEYNSALQARIEQLSQAVEARDTFIAVAAHELRNPMMPIIGQIELLLSAIRSGRCSLEMAAERLGKIQETVRQYMKRAVVLLDVSRLNSGSFQLQPVDCDLALLMREIVEHFTAAAHFSGVKLAVNSPECLPGLWDRLAVEQIIDNLLSNAIKYGGRSAVELTLAADELSVIIEVRDHGKGIAPADRARIFERFERAVGHNEYRSGFGIGLWVVGQLVAAMKGTVAVEEPPGGGALFKVKLPRDSEVST